MTQNGRIMLESLAERDRRVRNERLLAAAVKCGWWIITHCIAFVMGAFTMWESLPIKTVLEPIYVRVPPAPLPTKALLQWQCDKQEHAEYHEACGGRERMAAVK